MKSSIAVYIHWPYCLKKCPYCDFNSHVTDLVDHDAWQDAYKKEIKYYAKILGDRHVSSVFFGGGTPSLMAPKTIESILAEIASHWNIDKNCEITIEANPTSIEAKKFQLFKNAGINRVSVGVQSLRDDQLQFLGREHSAIEALKALEIANKTFDRMSFDLIYARPNQTMKDWENELNEALQYENGHLSLYQLTIEDGTQFKTLRDSGRLKELDYDIAGDMYAMTSKIMGDAGVPAYEISNYARSGQESRHNLTYWQYQDYIGIGPGAHGRITLKNGDKIATRTHKAPDIWMKHVFEKGHGAKPFETLTKHSQIEECIMMGLRLRDGIYTKIIPNNTDLSLLIDNDFLKINGDKIHVPQNKWSILDSILAKILIAIDRATDSKGN